MVSRAFSILLESKSFVSIGGQMADDATLPPSNRSRIPSFIVMDVLRDAAEKDRKLMESGSDQRVLHLEVASCIGETRRL